MTLSTLASIYSPNILAKLNHQKNNQASVKIDFFFLLTIWRGKNDSG